MEITLLFVDDVMAKKYISDKPIDFFIGPFNYPAFFFPIEDEWEVGTLIPNQVGTNTHIGLLRRIGQYPRGVLANTHQVGIFNECIVHKLRPFVSHDLIWSPESAGMLPQSWCRWFCGDVSRVEQLDVSAKLVDYDDYIRETHISWEWTDSSWSIFVS